MKLKKPKEAAHRRQLRNVIDGGALSSASKASLSGMMKGYAASNGLKASSGSRRARAHLTRVGAGGGGMSGMYGSLDRMVANMLLKGPMTTNVLGSVFGISPGLTSRF
jgi:hypothetical protein